MLGKTHRYLYDELGRLRREDDEVFGFTTFYTYNGGNITSVTKYPYTADEFPSGTGSTLTYHYAQGSDKLLYTIFDGAQQQSFSYDSAGNPLLWNGSVLQWERGRQLKAFGGITFTYDAGGVRQSKTANGVTTSYFTEGNRIHREERSDGKTLLYAYDASGLASITYNGTLYFVQKNFQGDIVALVDQNGNVVAKYVYDAWGNGKVCNASGTENTSSSFIGNINPFRYRGYYYDVETGLYYLQTRYYEPRAGRFLNADSVDYIAPDLIGGLNLYAYCNNNPVMYSDPEGVWAMPNWLKWVIGGAVIVGLGIATIATGGAAAGAARFIVAGALKGAIIGAVSGALVSGTIQGVTSIISGTGFWSGFADGAANGFMSGAIIGGITGALSSGVQVANAAKSWAATGGKSGFQQMALHYNKHVTIEGQKSIAKNIVNYTKQAQSFFSKNNASGYLLREGVIKIAGAPGGIFNTDGLIRSFWYIL